MEIEYSILRKEEITSQIAQSFVDLLQKQGKVVDPSIYKIQNCKTLCYATVANEIIAIGAIKRKTPSDFSKDKANLPELSANFTWELGYIYILPKYQGKHIATEIVDLLLAGLEHENLMASTEIDANPKMVQILEKRNFVRYGNTWKSGIHGNLLGLFLRYKC
jgi:hypothetical protein